MTDTNQTKRYSIFLITSGQQSYEFPDTYPSIDEAIAAIPEYQRPDYDIRDLNEDYTAFGTHAEDLRALRATQQALEAAERERDFFDKERIKVVKELVALTQQYNDLRSKLEVVSEANDALKSIITRVKHEVTNNVRQGGVLAARLILEDIP